MNTDTRQIYFSRRFQLRGATASVGRFLWHFVQMVLAMEVGMMVYHMLLFPLLASTGYAAVTKAHPLFGYWMMLMSMVLGMLVLMRFHRSNWRYCLEMTVAMLIPLAALTVLVLYSLSPIHLLYQVGDPVMFLAMAIFMLVRPGHHHHGSSEAEMIKHPMHGSHEVHEENQEARTGHTA